MESAEVINQSVKKAGSINYYKKQSIPLYIMTIVPVLLVFLFNYIPMFGLVIAFKNYRYDKGIWGSQWVGFKNFKFFFKSDDFARITINTLWFNSMFIIIGTIAAILVAILLYEISSSRFVKVSQTILITPHFISWVVASSMLYAILHPEYGFLNMILSKFNIEKVKWYSMPGAWNYILIIANVWKYIGFNAIIYYAALMGIDSSYFEAAKIDGANKFQINIHIILPCLTSLVMILTILNIGSIFRADFGLFYQLTRNVGALYSRTDVIDTYVFRSMREGSNISVTGAIGFLQSIVGFVVVLITNYVSKKIDNDYALF